MGPQGEDPSLVVGVPGPQAGLGGSGSQWAPNWERQPVLPALFSAPSALPARVPKSRAMSLQLEACKVGPGVAATRAGVGDEDIACQEISPALCAPPLSHLPHPPGPHTCILSGSFPEMTCLLLSGAAGQRRHHKEWSALHTEPSPSLQPLVPLASPRPLVLGSLPSFCVSLPLSTSYPLVFFHGGH